MLSANEEFQSTNEELETAKEELQSANEELTTTNDELRNRNRELAVTNAELDKARSYADAIIETMRDPLLVLDSKLKVQRANRAFYAYFIGRPDETEGRLLYEVGRGQWNIPSLRERLEAVLARDEPMVEFELEHDFGAIGPRVMCMTARRITGDAGREELMLLSIEDITERRANTDTLREGSRRKDEFLAMLAHELRNPLTPITHAIHLLRRADQDTNDSSQKLHEMIERQTQRLVRLVDELLDVARISRGIIELKRELVDLVALVRHTAESGAARIEERRHTLSLTLPSAPVLVDGDAVRLEQVVANLLENAVKYTEPGGRIALTLTEEQSEAVLSVRDTGIGLAPETLESIFDLFTQVDNSPARAGGGLGLGLTVVRRVLELHRGRIEARSSGLGHGSEFIVRLPRLPALHSATRAERPTTGRQSPATTYARRVLIVDDNEDSAQSLALLVRSWGHEVAVAHDGASALTLAEQFAPETALIDIGLPGMNGYELARRLREHPTHGALYLVAMTGYGREEDRSAARAAGFDVHLIKPADPDKLQVLLANGASVPAKTAPRLRSTQEP